MFKSTAVYSLERARTGVELAVPVRKEKKRVCVCGCVVITRRVGMCSCVFMLGVEHAVDWVPFKNKKTCVSEVD